ncbi:MAG: hypothetical protein JJU11_17040 [Candidatus Sumerlaeia bacterium]|nr:hypothetical protein [Candidatus Sumerlaeia bacterium]
MSLFFLLLLGSLAAILTGFAYGFLVHKIGYLKFGIALSILAAFAFGGILHYLTLGLKIRSVLVTALVGLMTGLVFTWAVWVGWIFSLTENQILLLNPYNILVSAINLGAEGVYTVQNSTPKGGFLYMLWILQTLVFLGAPMILPSALLSGRVFSEQSGKWMNEVESFPLMDLPADSFALRRELEQGNFNTLLSLPFSINLQPVCLLLEVRHGGDENDIHVLRVQKAVVKVDKKGNVEFGKSNVTKGVHIPRTVLEALAKKTEEFHQELERLVREEEAQAAAEAARQGTNPVIE